MKRVTALILSLLFLIVSCSINVYIDEEIDNPYVPKNIWRVGSVYFETADEAVSYIMDQNQSRAVVKTEDENRIIVLTRPVLCAESDGIVDSSYESYVEDESLRGSITIPSTFTGSITIDFGGYRYDFANSAEAFFVINGGDNVYIYNGESVIFNEASHTPYAIAVNSDVVTIDEHLIDDRRVDNKLLYVGEEGHLKIENTTGPLGGEAALVTDGTSGGILDIESSSITFSNIYTMYKNADGTISDKIDDSIVVAESARSKINIYSGDVKIEKINNADDYYNTTTSSIYDKAYLNILGTSDNTTIGSRHEIYEVVEKAIDSSSGDASHAVVHDMTHYKRVEATCIRDGHIEYWTCDASEDCIGRYYTNEEGSVWITNSSSLILPQDPEAHSIEHVEAKTETCTEDGNIEYWHCILCDKYYSDESLTIKTTKDAVIIPHHILSAWQYDDDSHWKICPLDGIVLTSSHTWGEYEEHVSGAVTHLVATCSTCQAKKVASKPDYLIYNIGIGEAKLKALADTPCGDFYVNGVKTSDNASVTISSSEVTVEFVPYLNSNTNYSPSTFVLHQGAIDTVDGEKDSSGSYSVSLTIGDKKEYVLNIQLYTEGGTLGWSCSIYKGN